MLQDSIILKQRHEKFIKNICKSGIVFGLENTEGFAMSTSNKYEDENGELIDLICFWSEKSIANSCAKSDWKEYKPTTIKLSDFIENLVCRNA